MDDYEWLRDKESPEVTVAYLEAENAYTEERTAHLADLRQSIFEEIKARTRETDLSVPTRNRGHWYYGRSFEGKEYGASCRVPVAEPDGWTPPQPAEDCAPDRRRSPARRCCSTSTSWPRATSSSRSAAASVSLDGNTLAFSVDVVGDERYTLRVKDLATGELLPDEIAGALGGATWDPTGQHALLHDRRRRLAARQGLAAPCSAPPRPTTSWSTTRPTSGSGPGVGRTRSDRFLVIASGSKTTTEYRVLDADDPTAEFRVVAPRREGVEYSLEHAVIAGRGPSSWSCTTTGAENFELGTAPVDATPPDEWTPLIPHDAVVRLEDVDAFAGHLVVHQRSEGLTQLRILELDDRTGVGDRRLPGRVRRGGLHGRLRRQPRVRPADGPARLHDDGGAGVGLRLRRRAPAS